MSRHTLFFFTFYCLLLSSCNTDESTNTDNTTTNIEVEEKTNSSNSAKLFTFLSSEKTGIQFSNEIQQSQDINIIYYDYLFNGGGVAVGDFNNDGLQDAYFTGNFVPNKLYLNKGNFQFEDITERAKVDGWYVLPDGKKRSTWSSGATVVDINNDGWLDIYVCKSGPYNNDDAKRNLLFVNNGDANEGISFTESAKEYGIDDTGHSTQATFFDYDKDGDLDLYVLNHAVYFTNISMGEAFQRTEQDKAELQKVSSHFYENQGNGKFREATGEAGLLRYGYGLGVVASDLNNDGWTDLYVSCDFSTPDYLFINNKNGTFRDAIKEMTGHISYYGMGCDIADINNDTYPEISVVDMTAEDRYRSKTLMPSMNSNLFWALINDHHLHYQYMFNTFQLNNGNGTFSEISQLAGLHKSDWSWANLMADFDNDGYKDILITNGFKQDTKDNDFLMQIRDRKQALGVKQIPKEEVMDWVVKMESHKTKNFIYKNNGDLTFSKKISEWGLDKESFSNGAAYVDLDNDGDLDLLVNNIDEPAFVLQNNAVEQQKGNYLRIKLEGAKGNEMGLNAKVTVTVNGQQQFIEQTLTRGYESACDNVLHFGVGEATEVVAVEVTWGNGRAQSLSDIAANQTITLKQADANDTPAIPKIKTTFSDLTAQAGLDFKHKENEYDDFAKEILLPQKQSTNGPFIGVGDVNGDLLQDCMIGGAKGQAAALYLQQKNGKFAKTKGTAWEADKGCEDMGIAFFDADGDGDLDIYVVSGGGGEFGVASSNLQDRLYLNDGKGNFEKAKDALPQMLVSGQSIAVHDFDGDEDLDIFVGGRGVPGKYPFAERSFLLQNEGGKFKDVTENMAPELVNVGMVNDALWSDFDGDGTKDLIVVGEWMPLQFFQNKGGKFTNVSADMGLKDTEGWWFSIAEGDFNKDGRMDYVVGNLGLNSKFKADEHKPFEVFADDFDGTGSIDIVLATNYQGNRFPVRGRECTSEQMPFVAEKFPTYHEFALADMAAIYGNDKLDKALHRVAKELRSCLLLSNSNGNLVLQPLPNEVQVAPNKAILVKDVDMDGNLDVLVAGNMYDTEVETMRYDAGIGGVLKGDGTGNFTYLNVIQSGFYVNGNVRDMADIELSSGGKGTIVSKNNGATQLFLLRQ
ncbi:MAG: VCBS repeat-containing protein [Chitinophagales bacterium]